MRYHVILFDLDNTLVDQKASQINHHLILYPGILTTVKHLCQYPLLATGLVTSGSHHEIDYLVQNYPVFNHFWVTITADTVTALKPAPDPLIAAVDRIGMRPQEGLYIGDALTDEEAAQNAKMDFGIAAWGADPKIHFNHARYRFQNPLQILNTLHLR